jgi:GAF domain-containing protein
VDSEESVFEKIRSALATKDSREAKARMAAELIRGSREYRWAGIYEIDGEEIAAIAWTGPKPPAFPRFPRTQGLCGASVQTGTTVVVGDVAKDPRYLTTFGSTRSEIVVPILRRASNHAIGLIDVESEKPNAFGDADRIFLEGCAALVAVLWE